MNRPDRFWRSIDVLATAYLEGSFRPFDCTACGIGNLIAADLDGASTSATSVGQWPSHSGSEFGDWPEAKNVIDDHPWALTSAILLLDFEPVDLVKAHPLRYDLLPLSQYSVTEVHPQLAKNLSYTNEELLRIEAVLLEKTEIDSSEDELFEGLMAVVDVLMDIHEVEDKDLRGQAKAAFKDQEYDTVGAVL
jgi:hypothetical protein